VTVRTSSRHPVGCANQTSAAQPDHTDAFLAQELSGKRVWKAWAVLARALGSPLALYFATPAQYNASAAASPDVEPSAISR